MGNTEAPTSSLLPSGVLLSVPVFSVFGCLSSHDKCLFDTRRIYSKGGNKHWWLYFYSGQTQEWDLYDDVLDLSEGFFEDSTMQRMMETGNLVQL